jgi:hypothetical protein
MLSLRHKTRRVKRRETETERETERGRVKKERGEGERIREGRESQEGERREGGDSPASIKPRHGHMESLSLCPESVCDWDPDVLEDDLSGGLHLPSHLPLVAPKAQARCVFWNHNARDAFGSRATGATHDEIDV